MAKDRIAVALTYEKDTEQAPKIVATGKGQVAQKIIDIADESGVAIVENPSLAETLGQINLGSEIPPELYSVVAEILAFVYSMDRK